MYTDEAWVALRTKVPVIHSWQGHETEYKCVKEIVFKLGKGGKEKMYVKLADYNGHSFTITEAQFIKFKERKEEKNELPWKYIL